MPWCHTCNVEYREGFTHCADCGEELKSYPPEPPAKEEWAQPEEGTSPKQLTTAADRMEAEIIKSKLEAEGIPVYLRHRETGDYLTVLMGATPFGLDVFVPESAFDKAQEILEIGADDIDFEAAMAENPDAKEQTDREMNSQNHRVAFFAALAVILLVIIFLILR